VSQSYGLGEVTLWNPCNGRSRLFLRQAALFEEELALPSGDRPDGAGRSADRPRCP
jgi:hypothetical protein